MSVEPRPPAVLVQLQLAYRITLFNCSFAVCVDQLILSPFPNLIIIIIITRIRIIIIERFNVA